MARTSLDFSFNYADTLNSADQTSLGWPRFEYLAPNDFSSTSTLPVLPYDSSSSANEQPIARQLEQKRMKIATRQPRRLTTKEDAMFKCQFKDCGKLFIRDYNRKAHMKSHDASREYPFHCPTKGCNKNFTRGTDLRRHHDGVHMKQRNFHCNCKASFARKDTLKR